MNYTVNSPRHVLEQAQDQSIASGMQTLAKYQRLLNIERAMRCTVPSQTQLSHSAMPSYRLDSRVTTGDNILSAVGSNSLEAHLLLLHAQTPTIIMERQTTIGDAYINPMQRRLLNKVGAHVTSLGCVTKASGNTTEEDDKGRFRDNTSLLSMHATGLQLNALNPVVLPRELVPAAPIHHEIHAQELISRFHKKESYNKRKHLGNKSQPKHVRKKHTTAKTSQTPLKMQTKSLVRYLQKNYSSAESNRKKQQDVAGNADPSVKPVQLLSPYGLFFNHGNELAGSPVVPSFEHGSTGNLVHQRAYCGTTSIEVSQPSSQKDLDPDTGTSLETMAAENLKRYQQALSKYYDSKARRCQRAMDAAGISCQNAKAVDVDRPNKLPPTLGQANTGRSDSDVKLVHGQKTTSKAKSKTPNKKRGKDPIELETLSDDASQLVKPKRPRSAYNFFFSYERATILGSPAQELSSERSIKRRVHRKTKGMIGFLELTKLIGQKWKTADASTRAFFDSKAAEDLKRYDREKQEYDLAVRTGKPDSS